MSVSTAAFIVGSVESDACTLVCDTEDGVCMAGGFDDDEQQNSQSAGPASFQARTFTTSQEANILP